MPADSFDLDNWFSFHRPLGDQAERYERIRKGARAFAEVILANTPASADQTTALRKLREVMMVANSAIACNEVDHQGVLL